MMVDTIQINKFSTLHNGKTIIFCKTDYLLSEFDYIKTLNNDIILISGNSDYVIDSNIIEMVPSNVKKWYAQNAIVTNDIVKCLPLGIENLNNSFRGDFHGIGYEHVKIKESIINNHKKINPTKFIYSNFNVQTNPIHRTQIKSICQNTEFIDWDEPTMSIESFFYKMLDYESVVCAQGNGPGDNHRIYETLYMNRIPITFNKVMYENLHHLFPVVLIERYEDLSNYEFMRNKINEAKNKNWDRSVLEMSYWIKNIINGNNQI
jgi:hypothetical protein